MPFGLDGILRGAALCFHMSIGFDSTVTTGNMVTLCPIQGVGMDWAALGHRGFFSRFNSKGDFVLSLWCVS